MKYLYFTIFSFIFIKISCAQELTEAWAKTGGGSGNHTNRDCLYPVEHRINK